MPIKAALLKFKKLLIASVTISAALAVGPGIIGDLQPPAISKDKVIEQFASSTLATKYQAEGGSFHEVLNGSKPEKLEARIGNETADVFDPKLEIKRWDGKASLRVSPQLKDVVAEKDKAVNFVGDKVDFRNGTNEAVQMYDLPDSEATPEGGYEMEWQINSAPKDNFFNFDINLTGIDCIYQPELTQQEKDEGGFRPDNVIGSYACYYSQSGDYSKIGGDNYKAGKAFHIYRPKAVDADGAWSWGTLDIKNNTLTVTVPQDFLDKATYPVKVDPTFGYMSLGASSLNFGTIAQGFWQRKGSLGQSGTITAISAGIYVSSGSIGWQAAIYNSSNVLQSPQSSTGTIDTVKSWETLTFNGPSITSGDWWIAAYPDNKSDTFTNLALDTGGDSTTDRQIYTTDFTYPNWPDPAPTDTSNRKNSIYATFTYGTSVTQIASGYGQYRAITIDHNKVASSTGTTLTNFPVLVSTTSFPSLATVTNGGKVTSDSGYDIQFATSTTAGNDALFYEREQYASTTGASVFWVNIPNLSTSTDTTIYMLYGNSGVTTDVSGSQSVWDANYKGVWHLKNGTTLDVTDSTGVNNGTNTGPPTATAGQIDGAMALSGSAQYTSVGTDASLQITGAMTIEAWVNPTDRANYNGIVGETSTNQPGYDYYLVQTTGKPTFFYGNCNTGPMIQAATAAVATSSWSSIAVTASGGTSGATIIHYLNGATNGSGTPAGNTATWCNTAVRIGSRNDGATMFKGAMDEVRISNVVRSADWLKTEYNNQNSPSTFYSVGAETSLGGGGTAATPTVIINGSVILNGSGIIN